jgi:hypothetical protein
MFGHAQCDFDDITIGKQALDRELECDIYAVLYHSLLNALEQKNSTMVAIHINKVKDSIIIGMADNGKKTGRIERLVDFELGDYMISRIAKENKTKVIWASAGDQNQFTLQLPLKMAQQRDKRLKLVS